MADIRKLVWCTAATAVTMAVGARLNNAAVAGWYQPLPKAPFTPPDAVFPIVWSVVYVLIAASFYLALTAAPGKHEQAGVNGLFISQLLMHILWTFSFFYCGYIGFALLVVVALCALSVYTLRRFYAFSRAAAALFVPCLVWLLFAVWLNAGFVYLNGLSANF